MKSIRERRNMRLGATATVCIAVVVACYGLARSPIVGSVTRTKAATLTSLTFKETSVVGGPMNPIHLEIAFTGTPDPGEVVRLRPEKNDATGWQTADPQKTPDPAKPAHVTFNTKDDTGPYIDVPLTGTSPVKVTIDTVTPDTTRKDTFLTGKIGTGDGVDSSKVTIAHDSGGK